MSESDHQSQQRRDRRPGALGALVVLPDELLCAVISRVPARDVCRLACASSVLYILCNEEPLWMSLCLTEGGLIEYKGSWKKTFLHRQNCSAEFIDTCQRPLHFDGFGSLYLYKRWYRCFTTLSTFSFDSNLLERKKNLSLEEFYSKYDGREPVLFTELSDNWPARNSWTIDKLAKKYGDISFRISQRSPKKLKMKFKDYVSYMELQHDEDPLYIFDDEFGEAAPDMLEDYSVPHLFQEDFFDVLSQDQRPAFRWLIIGPERSGASWHVDPALTSAWNTLILGRKRWALYPPGKVPAGVTVHVNEEDGDVDIDTPSSLQWWLDIYPLLADEDKPLECTQLPGETIFVPSGWWHCVLNLETTIAVTQNFVNGSNFEFVCLDMSPGHLHKGVCRAGLLAVQDNLSNTCFMEHQPFPDETCREKRPRLPVDGKDMIAEAYNPLRNGFFSYNIDFLSRFLDKDRDHYTSFWSASNCIGQREFRGWLHKLWAMKPDRRPLIWKGACLALNIEKWFAGLLKICASYNLPSPSMDEKFPVGTGSNPVFLVSDYVIKIFVEGGLESSIQSLGTELDFYNILHKTGSPLINHVPEILASGFLLFENGVYRTRSWDGQGSLEAISKCNTLCRNYSNDILHSWAWSKMQFDALKDKAVLSNNTWAYLITKRCGGDIFANLRESLLEDDILDLAAFLGQQLRNLHLLPVPYLQNDTSDFEIVEMNLRRRIHYCFVEDVKLNQYYSEETAIMPPIIPRECELLIATIDRRRRDLVGRLVKWGNPIPGALIEKVEDYVPDDISIFLNILKDTNGNYKFYGSVNWLHSDIMDDNIQMKSYSNIHDSAEAAFSGNMAITNGYIRQGSPKKWCSSHILDFSDLSVGDPVNDLIPIYVDVFRGDVRLFKQVLAHYGLPLSKRDPSELGECGKKFQRTSYRAMCYCILHEENVLGAIFSFRKDLRSAKSWEEVEEALWGHLNEYSPSLGD